MCHYKHLTLEEREKLLYFSAKGYSITEIAKELGRDKSTISRELRRNCSGGQYLPSAAQQMYSKRRKACRPCKRLDDPTLFQTVKKKFLEHQWSPEQIAGRLALERKRTVISYATIYRAIYSGTFDTGPVPMAAGASSESCGTAAKHAIPSRTKSGAGRSGSAMTSASAPPEPPIVPVAGIGKATPWQVS